MAYDKIFGEELARYNAAQKRADRKIPDYMEHIRTSKNGEKLFYENVVQVGTMYSCPVGSAEGETAAKILDEYMRDFERRNPNVYVFNAVLHLDEATPHLHIDWIPVARDYKNGLQIRNSLDKALKQQGIDGRGGKKDNSTQRWQTQERGEVIAVMERHGWEYEASLDTDRGNLTVDQYKAMVEEVDHRVNALPDQIEKKPVPLSKDKVVVDATELEALEQRAKLVQSRDTVTTNLREYRAEKQAEVENYVGDRMQAADQEAEQLLAAAKKKKAEAEKDAAAAFAMKQNQGRELAEAAAARERYERQYRAQIQLNDTVYDLRKENASLKAENASLKEENRSLRDELGKLKETITQQLDEFQKGAEAAIKAVETAWAARLEKAFEVVRDVCKAVGVLKYGKQGGSYRIDGLTERQGRLIDKVADYAAAEARSQGFEDFATDMEKNVGISSRLTELIDPPQKQKDKDPLNR